MWLLLHGTPLTPAVWDDVTGELSAAGPVSCPHVTGAGDPATAHDTAAARLIADLRGTEDEVHVVGHSFGGQVALDLTLRAPECVRSLTLLCSRDTPFPAFEEAATALRGADGVEVEAAMARWFRPHELTAGGRVVEYARRCLKDANRIEWADTLDAIAGYDRSDAVGRIGVPVTLIAAEHDQVSTPAAMAALAGRLRRATLHVIADAAHMSPFLDPGALSRLIVSASR